MSRAALAEKATLASERAKEFIGTGGGIAARARALVSGDARFFSIQPKPEDLRRHLDSDSIHEKRDAMKRIIAQMCKGYDMSNLFADVVKNIHTPSIELRKLIYCYITHYAEDRPNEALLSISAFQKDLLDASMHVRSLALRMLSAIRIPAIHPLVMLAVKKCSTDLEPLVRKTAAISLAQMHAINGSEEDIELVHELLQNLLADKSSEVAAAAALSFIEICPDEIQLIHTVYRDLCRSLADCEEWGQVVLLHVLLRYARTQFCDPNIPIKQVQKNSKNNDSDSESNDESSSSTTTSSYNSKLKTHGNGNQLDNEILLESDHQLLLDSVRPLFMSLNSGVVVAATSLFYHCAPKAELEVCVRPLMRLLGGPEEHHAIILSTIYTVVLTRPEPFIPYIKEFFLMPQDVRNVRELKLRIMSRLVTYNNFNELYREFRAYVRSFHVDRVVDAVRGLGLIAARVTTCASQIMRLLIPLLSHKNSDIVTESISVLRLLVVQGTNRNQTCQLVHRLLLQVIKGEITTPAAKASIIWLIGENIQLHPIIAAAAPECFRIFVKNFTQQTAEVKKQVLTLGCKLWLFLDGNSDMADRVRQLFFYLLELARFDEDYDVRDRGRLIHCTINRESGTFQALKVTLLNAKPPPQASDPYMERAHYELGTMSHLFGNSLFGYRELPMWATQVSDPSVRGPLRGNNYDNNNNNSSSSLLGSSSAMSSPSSSGEYSSNGSEEYSGSSWSESESGSDNNDNDSESEGSSDTNNNNNNNNNNISHLTHTGVMKRVPVKVVVSQINPITTTDNALEVGVVESNSPNEIPTNMNETNNNNNNDTNNDENNNGKPMDAVEVNEKTQENVIPLVKSEAKTENNDESSKNSSSADQPIAEE